MLITNLFLIALALPSIGLNAQYRSIPVAEFEKTRNAKEYYEDTANKFTGTFAPLEVGYFKVKIHIALIDSRRKKAFISGKVCSSDDCHPWGQPGVTIFKAKRRMDELGPKFKLATSDFIREYNGESIGGDFDVIFDFENDDRLYFYLPFSWIVEYNIGKLIK